MFHKGVSAAASESHNAAILLAKSSTVYAGEISPFGCFTVLQLFRSVVKRGKKVQERWSCLGTRQKHAESPGQVRRLSRRYHELSRRNQNSGTLSQCISQLTLQEEDAELCRLRLEGFLKPVYTNVDCNVLLRASKQESQ